MSPHAIRAVVYNSPVLPAHPPCARSEVGEFRSHVNVQEAGVVENAVTTPCSLTPFTQLPN